MAPNRNISAPRQWGRLRPLSFSMTHGGAGSLTKIVDLKRQRIWGVTMGYSISGDNCMIGEGISDINDVEELSFHQSKFFLSGSQNHIFFPLPWCPDDDVWYSYYAGSSGTTTITFWVE